jgi:hypothetical protein
MNQLAEGCNGARVVPRRTTGTMQQRTIGVVQGRTTSSRAQGPLTFAGFAAAERPRARARQSR